MAIRVPAERCRWLHYFDLGTGSTHEERRLLYDAMTRAEDSLTLGLPLRFYVSQQTRGGDRHVYAARTRFIPNGNLDQFEASHWSPAQQGSAARPAPTPIDVAATMRRMWT